MIYELRIYHMFPGRQQAICDRFANHTLKLFTHHGIKVTNFWVDAEGAERIYYICQFDSPEAKIAAWAQFQDDPAWIKARGNSELGGPIVEKIDSFVMRDASFFR